MKTEHTPGPWRVVDSMGDSGRAVVGGNNELIADCYADSAEGYNLPEDYGANARLIASAPELLDFALLYESGRGTPKMLNDMVRAAIAKATNQPK